MECKIGVMGKLTNCPEYIDGECIDIDMCIYKNPPLKERFNFYKYVIAKKKLDNDEQRYLDDDGYLTGIENACFLSKLEAENYLSILDEPDKFMICEADIYIKVN